MNDDRFWQTLDRPQGSAHPRYPDFVYPFDYGDLDGTLAADGGGVDVWIGSQPDRALTAIVCTVDRVKRDTEIKLLLGCIREEAQIILAIHNDGSQAAMLIGRGCEQDPMPAPIAQARARK